AKWLYLKNNPSQVRPSRGRPPMSCPSRSTERQAQYRLEKDNLKRAHQLWVTKHPQAYSYLKEVVQSAAGKKAFADISKDVQAAASLHILHANSKQLLRAKRGFPTPIREK